MKNQNLTANNFFIGWKEHNTTRKKAMAHQLSHRGLIIGVSIAFFVVLVSAQLLKIAYASLH